VAATIRAAARVGLENFTVFSCHKTMPKALETLFSSEGVRVRGLLCPGHVSSIIGEEPYRFLPESYGISCAIAGFEADEILLGILSLLRQMASGRPGVENCYPRAVSPGGNPRAIAEMNAVFRAADALWRGLGEIPGSGLEIRDEFSAYDASSRFELSPPVPEKRASACICGQVITGKASPAECRLFSRACTPSNPQGPCMVSSEGACAAWFKYGGVRP
jgi:hydrogenase expression/formation protein HypD